MLRILLLSLSLVGVWNDEDKKPVVPQKVEPAVINKLIEQLGSKSFEEREAANKRLREIGAPAVDALRKAMETNKDAEITRRARQLVEALEPDTLNKLFGEAVTAEKAKDFKKAAELYEQAVKEGLARYHPIRQKAPDADIPFLSEAYLRLARVYRKLAEYTKAGHAYHSANYYANFNTKRRDALDKEWEEMAAELLAGWSKTVTAKIEKDATLKELAAKYPPVLLHSRRYAGGRYLFSTYSFIYETAEEAKHFNDVQIQFDNGGADNTFDIHMVVGQENRVANLSTVEFTVDPNPKAVGLDGTTKWESAEFKAIEKHVYLEHIKDNRGNDFYVVFQVIAVDPESRFVAFIWRKLPGGTVVKRDRR